MDDVAVRVDVLSRFRALLPLLADGSNTTAVALVASARVGLIGGDQGRPAVLSSTCSSSGGGCSSFLAVIVA